MKKLFLFALMLCSTAFAYAQHDMKNMPGMKMADKEKPAPDKKAGIKNKTKTPAKLSFQKKKMPVAKDTMPEKHDMPMDMNMSGETDTAKSSSTDESFEKVNLMPGKTVRYDLYVRDTILNYTGKNKHAIAVNGSTPMPTLYFTEGDTAEIYLHNELKTETSLHWHGVFLTNRFDGVPNLTTAPILPGTTHLYKFAVVQNGTYWYHSHSTFQEQLGMNAALIFRKREETPMKEYTLVLSEWTDEKPYEIQRRLRTANDWYAIEKGSTQSYAEAISKGYFSTKIINEWKRMKAMDVSDIYYNRFLANGKPENEAPEFKAGDKVKLHIVNAGTSTYFWLQFAGGKLTVIGNDGNDVEPVQVDRLMIAVAETYDVVVTIPKNMSYEFRAPSEDRTKAASLWLGSGMKMKAPVLPHLKYFEGMKMMNDMMKMNGNMKDMGMNMSLQQMDMNNVMYPEITGYGKKDVMSEMKNMEMPARRSDGDEMHHYDINEMQKKDSSNIKMNNIQEMKADTSKGMNMDNMHGMKMDNMPGMDMKQSSDILTLNYAMLRSTVKTTLPDAPTKNLHFVLEGNMNRYIWTINNKTVNETDRILIKKGENVRIILTNNSMMRHPMHLHGHDFRVLNGHGDYAPLKNVIDIMPIETDTLVFAATESGDWFFHCHILYHMMTGMGRVFTYENSPVNPELPDRAKAKRDFRKDNRMLLPMASIGLESNGSDGAFKVAGNRYELQGLWHLGLKPEHGYEAELNFGRYLGKMQWLFPYVGFDYHYKKVGNEIEKNSFGQISNKNNRKTFVAGMQYTLPMLLVADARVDLDGKFLFQLGREDVPISRRLRFNFKVNTDKEYTVGLKYILRKWFALSTHYDSDMGWGAGVTLNY
ncbi:MAG: multicopper oxidase domain-containing protein [Ginsengibacter sp.]